MSSSVHSPTYTSLQTTVWTGHHGDDEVDEVDDVLLCLSSVSSSSSMRKVGRRDARVSPQNLLGDRPLLTAVKRHPRWSEHCAHSAMVQAYLTTMETNVSVSGSDSFSLVIYLINSK